MQSSLTLQHTLTLLHTLALYYVVDDVIRCLCTELSDTTKQPAEWTNRCAVDMVQFSTCKHRSLPTFHALERNYGRAADGIYHRSAINHKQPQTNRKQPTTTPN